MAERLQVLVEGGKATAGAPLGPALGPLGLNIMQVVKDINDRTGSFAGMKVPVTLVIDPKTKSYEIEVGTPPVSALINKEAGIEKGSGDPGKTSVGNLTIAGAIKIADMKGASVQGKDRKARVLTIVGTCVSMGVTVEGMSAKEAVAAIKTGQFDAKFSD